MKSKIVGFVLTCCVLALVAGIAFSPPFGGVSPAKSEPEWTTLNVVLEGITYQNDPVIQQSPTTRVFYRYWSGKAYFTRMVELQRCWYESGGYTAVLQYFYYPSGTQSQFPQWPLSWWPSTQVWLSTTTSRIYQEGTSTAKLVLLSFDGSKCKVQVLSESPHSNKWVQYETFVPVHFSPYP